MRSPAKPVSPVESIGLQNVVETANLGRELELAQLSLDLDRAEYDPEQFPGLVYRPETLSVVVLLFGSGKMVVTGATERRRIQTAVETVASRLDDLGLLSQ